MGRPKGAKNKPKGKPFSALEANSPGFRDELGRWVVGAPPGPPRPTIKTKELIDELCTRLMTRNLLQVTDDLDMPHYQTVFTWMSKDSELNERIKSLKPTYVSNLLLNAQKCIEAEKNPKMAGLLALRLKSAQWWAERILRSEFGNETKITGSVDAPFAISVKHIK